MKCAKCNFKNAEHRTTCVQCLHPLSVVEVNTPVPPTVEELTNLMYQKGIQHIWELGYLHGREDGRAEATEAAGAAGRAPVAWLCVSSDGQNTDAVSTEHARDTYKRAGRTITPLQPSAAVDVDDVITCPHCFMCFRADDTTPDHPAQ